jgi:phosphatidate cytidylyltransferase
VFDPALRQRAVSSVVLATGALVVVMAGGWLFIAAVLVAAVIMAGEWTRLAGAAPPTGILVAVVAAGTPILAVLALAGGAGAWALAVMLLAPLLGIGIAVGLGGDRLDRVAGGAIYVGLPALALVWLRTDPAAGAVHVLWLMLVVWCTDICAYFVGRSIGGPKLAPRISPGKTWAGLVGGMGGAGVVGGLMALTSGAGFWFAAVVATVLAVVAQVGDLFESALKRDAGVKDSGHLIPGHGGLLDRIDGLLFASPVFAGLVWLGARGGLP